MASTLGAGHKRSVQTSSMSQGRYTTAVDS